MALPLRGTAKSGTATNGVFAGSQGGNIVVNPTGTITGGTFGVQNQTIYDNNNSPIRQKGVPSTFFTNYDFTFNQPLLQGAGLTYNRIAGPDPDTHIPHFRMPPDACDAHCHIFGPAGVFPFAPNASYIPPDAPFEALQQLHAKLGISRAVIRCRARREAGRERVETPVLEETEHVPLGAP